MYVTVTYIAWSSGFALLCAIEVQRFCLFVLKNILVLLAKRNSGELHCPVTALVLKSYCLFLLTHYCLVSHKKGPWKKVKAQIRCHAMQIL